MITQITRLVLCCVNADMLRTEDIANGRYKVARLIFRTPTTISQNLLFNNSGIYLDPNVNYCEGRPQNANGKTKSKSRPTWTPGIILSYYSSRQ